jgi:hypothetical protein
MNRSQNVSLAPLLQAGARPVKLLDQVWAAIWVRHYSIRTEDAYVDWVRRFISLYGKCHLLDMGGG